MDVIVNGQRRQVPAGCSLAQVLQDLGITPDRVAVEMNGSIVRKRDWPEATVPGGSQIEIVEFVGGG